MYRKGGIDGIVLIESVIYFMRFYFNVEMKDKNDPNFLL